MDITVNVFDQSKRRYDFRAKMWYVERAVDGRR